MGWAGNVFVGADKWLEAENEWQELRLILGANQWIEVRYEELVANARVELEGICRFMGVDFSERMFDYASGTSYKLPDPSLNYQWKKRMRVADVQRLEAKMGKRLRDRAYPLSNHPQLPVSGIARKLLYLHSRWKVFLFRVNRFGPTLTLQETISRRLGLKEMHEKALSAMNRITDTTLQ
jgi:hypothetical protein